MPEDVAPPAGSAVAALVGARPAHRRHRATRGARRGRSRTVLGPCPRPAPRRPPAATRACSPTSPTSAPGWRSCCSNEPWWGPSLDHTVWFHHPARMDDWVLVDLVPRRRRRWPRLLHRHRARPRRPAAGDDRPGARDAGAQSHVGQLGSASRVTASGTRRRRRGSARRSRSSTRRWPGTRTPRPCPRAGRCAASGWSR